MKTNLNTNFQMFELILSIVLILNFSFQFIGNLLLIYIQIDWKLLDLTTVVFQHNNKKKRQENVEMVEF